MTENNLVITIDGISIALEAKSISALDLLALAGAAQGGHVLDVSNGRARLVHPDEMLSPDEIAGASFRTFDVGMRRELRVDGMRWDWIGDQIRAADIRQVAGLNEDAQLRIGRLGSQLGFDAVLDLAQDWPPQVYSEPHSIRSRELAPQDQEGGRIVINGRSSMIDREDISYDELVSLAFPDVPLDSPGSNALTVTFRNGTPERPEGSLIKRDRIRLHPGTVFNVTATNKS